MSDNRTIQLIDNTFEYKFDIKNFLGTIWNSQFDLYDLKFGAFLKKIPNSIKKRESLEDIAFELVFSALHATVNGLLQEHCSENINKSKNIVIAKQGFRLDSKKEITDLKIEIDESFIWFPTSWSYLRIFKIVLADFLKKELNVKQTKISLIIKSIPEFFWLNLISTYEKKPKKYKIIPEYFNISFPFPFSKNHDIFIKRSWYYRKISQLYDANVMNHLKMKLSHIYVEPNFKIYHRHLPKGEYNQDGDGFIQIPFDGENLHDYIEYSILNGESGINNLEIPAERSRLILLLGQPGQGKTSFCYRTIYNLNHFIDNNKELVFYKLNQLEGKARQFLKTPFDILESIFTEYNFSYKQGLLILDGLDELYMTQGLTKAEITEFFRTIKYELQNRPDLTILVTSRFHYVDLSRLGKNELLILSLSPMSIEQQKTWLEKYIPFNLDCKLRIEDLIEIHTQKDENLKGLRELVNQPILLQLVAKAEFEIKKLENRGKIYENLFNTLINRSWANGQLKKFEIDRELFREFLRELAHHIYHSNREFIKVDDLQKLEKTNEFIKESLIVEHEEIGESLKDVLITFYFKPVDENQVNDKAEAIEFYHKSLQEYLAMEHIWNKMLDEMLDKKTHKKGRRIKYTINDNDWKDTLKLCWSLSTPKKLTKETSKYLREIILNDNRKNEKNELYERMTHFFPDLLDHQFQYHFQFSEFFQNPTQLSMSCFYVYWTILSHLADISNIITEENKKAFCDLLMIHQRLQPNFLNLQKVNFEGAEMEGINLANANLKGANFVETTLKGADFSLTNLDKVDFSQAELDGASFFGSHINETEFFNSGLNSVNFARAIITNAFFGGATLTGSNFYKANLDSVNFTKAKMYSVRFYESILSNIELDEIEFFNKDFLLNLKNISAKANDDITVKYDFYEVKGEHNKCYLYYTLRLKILTKKSSKLSSKK